MTQYTSIATLLSLITISLIASASGIDEATYRSKYPFSGEKVADSIEKHPNGVHRVVANYVVRECDVKEGKAIILSFYGGSKLLRSYSLSDLFPKQKDRFFHPASGVFLWLVFSPDTNGFSGNKFTVVTATGVRVFDIFTGKAIKTKTEQKSAPNP